MDFTVDSTIRDQMHSISSRFDLEYWRGIDKENKFPSEYWDSLSNGGLFGILIDEHHGGMGQGVIDLFLAVEETSERFAGLGSYLYLSGALTARIFSRNGTIEQKTMLLPRIAKGEAKFSIALSEELSGFNASAIETSAKKDPTGKYSLNGSKMFVNNADLADYLIVFGRTSSPDSAKKSSGITMFLVDSKDKNIKKRKLERLGMNFVNSFALEFQDVIVEESAVIGEVGKAWYNIVEIFNLDRILTAASLVGTGRLALKVASDWANNRTVFGKRIGENQGIQFPLADASAQLGVSEIMGMKAASLADQGKSYDKEASYALLSSANAASAATDRAMQTLGGHGYYNENHVERFWRDVRAHKVHPISEELLLASIAERALGLPKSY